MHFKRNSEIILNCLVTVQHQDDQVIKGGTENQRFSVKLLKVEIAGKSCKHWTTYPEFSIDRRFMGVIALQT